MTWQEIVGIAGAVSLGTSGAVTLILKYIFQKNIDSHVEHLKHDLNKDAINAQLLISERHKIIPELYRLIMIADGAIQGPHGITFELTYEEFSEKDFEELFERRNIALGEREKILELFRSNPTEGINEWRQYDRMLDREDGRNAYQKAKNELFLQELYLPDDIATKYRATLSSLWSLWVYYSHDDLPIDKDDREKIKGLKTQITIQLEELKNSMKAFLHGG